MNPAKFDESDYINFLTASPKNSGCCEAEKVHPDQFHKRQCIEAGFRELKQHWNLERLPFEKLIHNEFQILCKIVAMTLFRIFQVETLPPKQYRTLQRKTFFRRVLSKGLRITAAGKVVIALKNRYTWLLRRLLSKIAKMNFLLSA